MKKILFFFSALSVLILFPGCMTGYHSVVVVSDYDERCWLENHWVYRFYESDRWIYRRWYQDRWEEDRREDHFWLKVKWERAARDTRDDGRKYDNDQNRQGKQEKSGENKGKSPSKMKHKK